MKKGFWTGLLALIIANVLYAIIINSLDSIFWNNYWRHSILWDIAYFMKDDPLTIRMIFLILTTVFIYKILIKINKSTQHHVKNDKSVFNSKDFDKKNKNTNLTDYQKHWLRLVDIRVNAASFDVKEYHTVDSHGVDHFNQYKIDEYKVPEDKRLEVAKSRVEGLLSIKDYIKTNGSEDQKFHHASSLKGAILYASSLGLDFEKKLEKDEDFQETKNLSDKRLNIIKDFIGEPLQKYSVFIKDKFLRAMANLQSGNHQTAAKELERIIEEDNYMLPAYYNLSAIKINYKQDYIGAIKILDKIINSQGYEKNPDKTYAALFFNRGLAKSFLNREEAAISDFDESLKIDAEYARSYGSRGYSLMVLKRNIEALEDFNKAISLGDKSFENYSNRAQCKQKLTKFNEALKDYQSAYELNPNDDYVNTQIQFLEAVKKSGLMDELDNFSQNGDSKNSIDEEIISFIYELFIRVSLADNEFDIRELLYVDKTMHNLKKIYNHKGDVKRAGELSFFEKTSELSDDEKSTIIRSLIMLILIDEKVTYSELSLVISYSLHLDLPMDNAENLVDEICNNETLDINTYYLYITEIFSSMRDEISNKKTENYDLINQISKLEHEEVAVLFKSLPTELKFEIYVEIINYDEKRSLARKEADEYNDKAWNKLESGDYHDALIEAKKSIDILSMSYNNDTIALIYYHLKNYNEAIKYANNSLNINQSRSEHYVTRAKIYLKIDEKEKAIIDLKKAIEIRDDEDAIKLLNEISN